MAIRLDVRSNLMLLVNGAAIATLLLALFCGNAVLAACSDSNPCGFGQVCSDGKCVSNTDCTPRASKECYNYDVYWLDSCGVRGQIFQDCGVDDFLSEYQCSRSMVQQKFIGRGCDQGQCMEVRGWVDLQNCADKGLVCREGACRAGDTVPPLLYYLSPSGNVTTGPATLSLTTSEPAECRYGYYDVPFDQMGFLFNSSNKLSHSSTISLKATGAYLFYVRCKDEAGNVNLSSSKIMFQYVPASGDPVKNPPENKDTTPPIIATTSLSPSGDVKTSPVEISLATNEKANCRYDIADTAFASMESAFESDAAGTVHRKSVDLKTGGRYSYFVRCKDQAGNMNSSSAVIEFNYIESAAPDLQVLETRPTGVIYQRAVALEAVTSSVADCRYSTAETDYNSMSDLFMTADGLTHTAVVTLADFGNYTYNVGCEDRGSKKIGNSQVTFEYKDPEAAAPKTSEEKKCETTVAGSEDDKCSIDADCVCDPDCAREGKNDPDCLPLPESGGDPPSILWLVIVAASVVVIGGLIFWFKRKGGGDDGDGSETDESLGL